MSKPNPLVAAAVLAALICDSLLIRDWARAAAPPSSGPAVHRRLADYVEAVDRCALFDQLTTGRVWRTVYEEDFAAGKEPGWSMVEPDVVIPPGQVNPNAPKLVKVDGRTAVEFGPAGEFGFLAVGPKVSGEFSVEIVAKSISERPCDMSIVTDRNGVGPGFQFGGYWNTRNILWTGPVKAEGDAISEQAVELPANPLIKPDTWHRVRMEVRDGHISGWVDGVLLGRARLTRDYDARTPRQVMVYAYSSRLLVDSVRIESRVIEAAKVDEAAAEARAFGERGRAATEARLGELVDLLIDDEEEVRDGALALLKRAGTLALKPLERAAAEGPPEQRQRAAEAIRAIRPTSTVAPAPPAKPAEDAQPPVLQPDEEGVIRLRPQVREPNP